VRCAVPSSPGARSPLEACRWVTARAVPWRLPPPVPFPEAEIEPERRATAAERDDPFAASPRNEGCADGASAPLPIRSETSALKRVPNSQGKPMPRPTRPTTMPPPYPNASSKARPRRSAPAAGASFDQTPASSNPLASNTSTAPMQMRAVPGERHTGFPASRIDTRRQASTTNQIADNPNQPETTLCILDDGTQKLPCDARRDREQGTDSAAGMHAEAFEFTRSRGPRARNLQLTRPGAQPVTAQTLNGSPR
jgi:hypothetical protein